MQAIPTELLRGSSLVAIRTSDHALVDFGLDRTPGESAIEEKRDLEELVGGLAVVELQDDRIRFTATDAGMVAQVRQKPATYIFPH